ncbi:MAG: LysM peptidoglycan-binding domain-containing protein [Deltaproteobacteria bacterium]|nr:LysM peptidoglycan-binding domain-containing protein [Deltaproteobacteria bacterium]
MQSQMIILRFTSSFHGPGGGRLRHAARADEKRKIPDGRDEVQRCDTLSSIGRRYGQEVQALIELNGLTSSILRAGQKLSVLLESLRGTFR